MEEGRNFTNFDIVHRSSSKMFPIEKISVQIKQQSFSH